MPPQQPPALSCTKPTDTAAAAVVVVVRKHIPALPPPWGWGESAPRSRVACRSGTSGRAPGSFAT